MELNIQSLVQSLVGQISSGQVLFLWHYGSQKESQCFRKNKELIDQVWGFTNFINQQRFALVVKRIGAKSGHSCAIWGKSMKLGMWSILIRRNILRLGPNRKAQYCVFYRPESDSHRVKFFFFGNIYCYIPLEVHRKWNKI